LTLLAQVEPRLAQVVEMRYFAGLTEMEVAGALGIAERTDITEAERTLSSATAANASSGK
jgi:DNA-directed RNA polymerase specialized sigma24 family protein